MQYLALPEIIFHFLIMQRPDQRMAFMVHVVGRQYIQTFFCTAVFVKTDLCHFMVSPKEIPKFPFITAKSGMKGFICRQIYFCILAVLLCLTQFLHRMSQFCFRTLKCPKQDCHIVLHA